MTKLTVISDAHGTLLGAVPSGPIKSGNVTVEFQRHPTLRYHEVEVADELLRQSPEKLQRELEQKISVTA
jgi:hypothetical protein